MNFDSINLSPLFEKSLVRVTANFYSKLTPSKVSSELAKELKRKVSSEDVGPYNIKLVKREDGVYEIETPFLLYRDARLSIISILKWIQRNGSTDKNHNLFLDLKFMDAVEGPFSGTLFNSATKIEDIDKLKFILSFDEDKVYDIFPSRRNELISHSIKNFSPTQKFTPEESKTINPRAYTMPNTENAGINFELLTKGFLRLQYIGGTRYEDKVNEILSILDEFCVTAWDCTVNKGFTRDNIEKFQRIIKKTELIRQAYRDYDLFKQNFPKVKFTIDLSDNDKIIKTYYPSLRDRIYEIISGVEFNGELELNYDSSVRAYQVKEAKMKWAKVSNVEFIMCELDGGNFTLCDFYNTKITNSNLDRCNILQDSITDRCDILNSFANRTTEINNSTIRGINSVLNGKMSGGSFIDGKLGKFANVSADVNIVRYGRLKPGFIVAGDKVIIPTKKYNNQ